MSHLELDRLAKHYGGVRSVDGIDLAVEPGEFICLLGPSGCGKTTTLRMIAGFLEPDAGEIRVNGRVVSAPRNVVPPERRNMGMIFQSYAVWPHMTVRDNVGYGLKMQKVATAEKARRVDAILGATKLAELAQRYPGELSGGQQQRVALARALAPRPKVLLLDEPLSALDLKLRKEMQGELKRLQRETGITFVLVTHDQEEALAMSDRIAVMCDGLVLQVGTPKAIYDNPNSRFVADFIGEANLVPGRLLGRSDTLTVAVRPERVSLARLNGHPARAQGQVAGVTFLGLDMLYEIMLDDVRVRARVRDAGEPFEPGEAVALDWPDTAERELRD